MILEPKLFLEKRHLATGGGELRSQANVRPPTMGSTSTRRDERYPCQRDHVQDGELHVARPSEAESWVLWLPQLTPERAGLAGSGKPG